ncbi:MAG: hypothetical protein Q8M65_12125 [Rhodoglobus sp.]|nr:hypothetical protein [Rhodoglobus sp.]
MFRRGVMGLVLVPVVGSVLLALTGCSIAPATASELSNTATFAENLTATQALVGGDWQVRDDPTGRSCSTLTGELGESTPALRIRVIAPATPPTLEVPASAVSAAAVASAWTRWGYVVTEHANQLSVGEVVEVQARLESGEYMVFRAGDKAMTLQGESGCKVTP